MITFNFDVEKWHFCEIIATEREMDVEREMGMEKTTEENSICRQK